MARFRTGLTVLTTVLLAAGCTDQPTAASNPSTLEQSETGLTAQTTLPADATTVLSGSGAAELALATSRALFARAPAVVLVGAADQAAAGRATSTAVDLGVPLLVTPAQPAETAALGAEVARLEPHTLIAVGDAATAWIRGEPGPAPSPPDSPAVASPSIVTGERDVITLSANAADNTALPDIRPGQSLNALLVLAVAGTNAAAAATAQAAGARVLMLAGTDPRAEDAAIKALAASPHDRILAVGDGFGPADRLRRHVDTAGTGVTLPGGGQIVFPGRRMVALYGHPGDSGLGVLGEQGIDAAVVRAQQVASGYKSLVDGPVVAAFEIIATVASASPGEDGDYSSETSVDRLRPWVDAARAAGMYVLLDLQPGRTDFLTQAKRYTELLSQPHVGLALDPEWRLKPDQVHLAQIGSVGADEINRTGRWLAELTRSKNLPQKVLMLHQFKLDMITDRSTLVTDYDELRVVIHADGFGSAGQKFNTWNSLRGNAPAGVWWGWKNFYDEDRPTFTPQETVAISPAPVFISYQ